MERISDLEKGYVLQALDNQFKASMNSLFNRRLEEEFARKFGTQYAQAVSNGTSALHTAVAACGIGPGDEVIVPPLTMGSTSLCVAHQGAKPVFADVNPKTFTICPLSVKSRITPRTKAIITVSLYGNCPHYFEIQEICKKHGLFLIEDNAECFLGRYKGDLVGSFGDFSCYSFQASKHMTCGDGGMLTTNSDNLATSARKFATLGYSSLSGRKGRIEKKDIQDPRFRRHSMVGYNYRMSEINAAVALGQLQRLEELVSQRIRVAKLFETAVESFDFLTTQYIEPDCKHTYWCFPLVLSTDNPEIDWYRFRDLFRKNGGEGFYAAWRLTYEEEFVEDLGGDDALDILGSCPHAEYLQPRLMQFQTNYWDTKEAEKQAEILFSSAKEYQG